MKSHLAHPSLVLTGVLLVFIGAVWTAQGLGYLPGSVMSGVTFWAVAGPLVALVGIILVMRGWRGRPSPHRRGG